MKLRSAPVRLAALLLLPVLAMLAAPTANAVPSFARQTSMACEACHTVWPELTHFGRPLPDSAGNGASQQNGTVAFPQQISLFYAGKIAPHAGAFIQLSYENASGSLGLDNTDIRFAGLKVLPGDRSLIYGVSLNNNPTVQDLWNSTPAFGFPYAASNAAPAVPFGAQIDGTRGQDVAGLSVYAFWNESLYGELGVYRSAKQGFDGALDSTTAGGVVSGIAPYWRFAYEHNWGRHSLEAGVYGMTLKLFPEGQVLHGAADRFQDVAQDLQYQYMGDKNLFSITATRIHEKQTLDATYAAEGSDNLSNDLTTTRAFATYYWKRRLGGTVGFFATTGTSDMTYLGGATAPDTKGWTAELNYVPWLNTKFSVQYTGYSKYSGLSNNYDGTGRNASDNNTLYILGWLSY
ncbi:MAG: cytochrome C [Proteobacteria bacterium]|nr:cytochrome C [Pseudomonadota bacterium]